MLMYNHLINIIIIGLIMAFVDIFYLLSMSSFFNSLIKNIQGTLIKLDYLATIIVYIFLVIQLYYFVLMNIKSYQNNNNKLVFDSFLLGLTTYGVYEFTNKAIIKNWTYKATLYDTLWGGILFSLTSLIYKYVAMKM